MDAGKKLVSPTRPLRRVAGPLNVPVPMVTIEKGAPCRRPRFISFDETAFDAPGPGPSRKRGAAGLDGFESAGSASSCGSEACTPLRLDFDAWDSDGDDSAASAGFRSPSPTKRRRPAPPTVRRKSCLARPGDSPYTPEVDRLAALSPAGSRSSSG
ncbi:hypothetical protein JL722_1886 [Aureococcus anophagefferens]|nr:hypothetical protein JL722_1886 [Aureococcus anophagefferens]